MSVNRYIPHVLLLPEDDANSRIANGFHLGLNLLKQRKFDVLRPAGGWLKVLELFEEEHIPLMNKYQQRSMILLIDFDGDQGRLNSARTRIPANLIDRVFILGAWTEPEALRVSLGPYETIGSQIAEDCLQDTENICRHELLRHNSGEFERLRAHIRPVFFP